MPITIRPAQAADLDTLQAFTVRAFAPIFDSFKQIMGPTVFALVYPDWQQTQRNHVTTFHNKAESEMWVADVDGVPAGLVVYVLDHESKMGEIEFLVVDPAYQQRGIATQLNEFALAQLRAGGMVLAAVSTGGDPSHAPARRAYESVGFTPVPSVWYVKHLE